MPAAVLKTLASMRGAAKLVRSFAAACIPAGKLSDSGVRLCTRHNISGQLPSYRLKCIWLGFNWHQAIPRILTCSKMWPIAAHSCEHTLLCIKQYSAGSAGCEPSPSILP